MAIGAFASLAVFVVLVGVVGVRLALLFLRTRRAPEGLLGAGLLLLTLSMPCTAIGRVPAMAMEPAGRVAFCLGLTLAWLGIALLMTFHQVVFRSGQLGGRLWLAGLILASGGSVAFMSAANFAGASVQEIVVTMRPGTLVLMATLFLSFVAGALDSFRYGAGLERRQALGIAPADPLLRDRFRLWGIASTASAALMLVIVGCALAGMTLMQEPLPLAAQAGAGTVMSVSWYLTFFAPAPYRRFVEARAARIA